MAKRYINLKVLKDNYPAILEDVVIAVVIGLAFIGLSALMGLNLKGGDWLGDISPLFVGLTGVYVAFSVLSVTLEENRKQAKLDRDLAVRPVVQMKSVPLDYQYPDEIYTRFSIAKVGDSYADEFGLLPRMDYGSSKFKADNSGLGLASNIRLVVKIGGQFFTSKGVVNKLEVGKTAVFRVSYTAEISAAESLFITYTDLYGNYHVVLLFFKIERNELVIFANQYLEQDRFSIGETLANVARKDQVFVTDKQAVNRKSTSKEDDTFPTD